MTRCSAVLLAQIGNGVREASEEEGDMLTLSCSKGVRAWAANSCRQTTAARLNLILDIIKSMQTLIIRLLLLLGEIFPSTLLMCVFTHGWSVWVFTVSCHTWCLKNLSESKEEVKIDSYLCAAVLFLPPSVLHLLAQKLLNLQQQKNLKRASLCMILQSSWNLKCEGTDIKHNYQHKMRQENNFLFL